MSVLLIKQSKDIKVKCPQKRDIDVKPNVPKKGTCKRNKVMRRESQIRAEQRYEAKHRLKRNASKVEIKRNNKRAFLSRCYANMRSRVNGKCNPRSAHLYEGLELMDREVFISMSLNDAEFNSLFLEWQEGDFERRLAPSPDRIDSSRGYTPDNIEWVPFHENCRRASYNQQVF